MLAFQGSIADLLTILVGICGIFVRPIRRRIKRESNCFTRFDCTRDFMNSVVIVPFAMLAMAPWFPVILVELTSASKLTMPLSGIVGLIFVIGELLNNVKPQVD